MKSQKQAAMRLCSSGRVALREGDWQALDCYWGKEIIGDAVRKRFREHQWVDTLCQQPRRERGCLQARLVKEGAEPSSSKYLWSLAELEGCKQLQK